MMGLPRASRVEVAPIIPTVDLTTLRDGRVTPWRTEAPLHSQKGFSSPSAPLDTRQIETGEVLVT